MKYEIKEIENRDPNTTVVTLDNGDEVSISWAKSLELLLSFLINSPPADVKAMVGDLDSQLQFSVLEYMA
jgi:hypothetical protein